MRLWLVSLLTLVPLGAGADQHTVESNLRLSKKVVPFLYTILLHPDLEKGTYWGKVVIKVNVTESCKHITLHQRGLNITQTKLCSDAGSDFKLKAFNSTNESWIVETEKVIPAGCYSLSLHFSGCLTPNGTSGFFTRTYLDASGKKRVMAATKCKPGDARGVYPCFDEPNFKAKMEVIMVRPSAGNYKALSNMNQVGEVANHPSAGLTTVKFAVSPPMSTYLTFLGLFEDFDSLPTIKTENGVSITAYGRKSEIKKMEYALNAAKAFMEKCSDYLHVKYPLPKISLLAIPAPWVGAMENWGLATCGESGFMYDPNNSVVTDNQVTVVENVAHVISHMWASGLVTMKWWNDHWMNEGLASFIEFNIKPAYEPKWHWDVLFADMCTYSMGGDAGDASISSPQVIRDVNWPNEISQSSSYSTESKAACLLRMTESAMGAENFRNGLSSYMKKFQYSNAETNNLWHELQPFAKDFKIQHTMDTWTLQPGYPVLNLEKNGKTITITQKRFVQDEKAVYDPKESAYHYKWDIPITYITSENKEVTLKWLHRNESSLTIDIGSSEWYKLNVKAAGYYIVNYPTEGWHALAKLLNKNYKALSQQDRATLLLESIMLAHAGHRDYTAALEMTRFLRWEDYYQSWGKANNHLVALDQHLFPTHAHSNFRKYMKSLISPHICDSLWNFSSKIPYIQRNYKYYVILMGCKFEVLEFLAKAKELFKNWLDNPEVKLDSEINSIVYYYGMAASGEEEWWKLWKRYLASPDTEKDDLIYSLCATKDPKLLARLLEFAKSEDSVMSVRSEDFVSLHRYMAKSAVGNNVLWKWVKNNSKYVEERLKVNSSTLGSMLVNILSHYVTEENIKEMNQFIKDNPGEGEDAECRKLALDKITQLNQWRNKHVKYIDTWLKTANCLEL